MTFEEWAASRPKYEITSPALLSIAKLAWQAAYKAALEAAAQECERMIKTKGDGETFFFPAHGENAARFAAAIRAMK